MDKKRLAQWLMVPATVILVLLLLTLTSLHDIFSALSSISLLYLAASLVLFIILYIARALRFAVMMDSRDIGGIFSIVCTHCMANNVMPFRTGELAFVYLAKTRMKVPVGIGAAIIAIVRLYDVLAICLMFIASLLLARDSHGYFSKFIPVIVLCTILLVMLIGGILWFNRLLSSFTARLFSLKPFMRLKPFQLKIEQVCNYCSTLRPGKSIVWILLLTVLMWAALALNYYLLTAGMGLNLDFWTAISGMLLAIVFVSLPIQGVGNFGSFEFAWSAIFVALGVPALTAVSSGFAVHAVVLAFTAIVWIYTLITDRFFKTAKKDNAPAHHEG